MSLSYASRAAALVGSSMAAATALLIDPRALVDAEAGASDRLATCSCEPVGASSEGRPGTRSMRRAPGKWPAWPLAPPGKTVCCCRMLVLAA